MEPTTYLYNFHDRVPMGEVDDSLGLAEIATKAIHGACGYRLDAHYVFDQESRYCRIESISDVGRHLATIFTALLTEQFGDDGFTITRGMSR